MLYVSARYDDDTYDVVDLSSNRKEHLTKTKFKSLLKGTEVLGAFITSDAKLYCEKSYFPYSVSDRLEADSERKDWLNNHTDCSTFDFVIEKINGTWWVFEPDYDLIPVYYGVYRLELGQYHYYVSKYAKDPATPYKESAKRFNKKEAYAVAKKLTNSKKNSYFWSVEVLDIG